MRALSEVISTIIIAGTIIAVSLTVFYYSLTFLGDTLVSTGYGYSKSILINLANNANLFIQGNTYVATLPSRYVGIGYKSLYRSIYVNITLPTQGATVNYVDIIISENNPEGTAYQGSNYYNVVMVFHLVDNEKIEVYLGLNDTAGYTVPAPTIVGNIYFANGSSLTVFSGIGLDVNPLYPLPFKIRLLPGDRFEMYMNDNNNDNNYEDGYFPLEITEYGLKSYNECWEAGSWYHYTWFIINNTNTGNTYEIPALYKPPNYSWPEYWYRINEVSFRSDNSTYYDFYYHQSDEVQYEISGLIPQTTQINKVVVKQIPLDYDVKSLYIAVSRPYVTEHKIIYGVIENNSCAFIVGNIRGLPCIQEYYKNGKSITELDFFRIYKTVYIIGDGENKKYLIRILYLRINPIVKSSSPTRIMAIPTGVLKSYSFENISAIDIVFYDNLSATITSNIDIDEIIPNRDPTIPIYVEVIIQELNLVLL